jgi:hypothetical protein
MTTEKAFPVTAPDIPVPSLPGPVPQIQGPDRVASLDWFKGFLMLCILYVHLGSYWGDGTWTSAWCTVWMILDWGGPVGFIAFTIIGTMISIKKKMATGKTRGLVSDAIKKFVYLFVIGEIMNLVIDARNPVHLGPWHVLGMNMITAVAFAQLFVYAIIKLTQNQLVLLVISMLVAFPLLYVYCIQGLGVNDSEILVMQESRLITAPAILYFLLFDMTSMMPVYGWLVLTPVVVIVFDGMVATIIRRGSNTMPSSPVLTRGWKALRMNPVSWLAIKGLVIASVAVIAGGFIILPGLAGVSGTFMNLTNPDPFRFWALPGVHLFLLRFSPQYLGLNLGIVAMVFSLCYRVREGPGKVPRRPTRIETFGQYSFSIFVYHHAIALIPLDVPLLGFIAVLFPVLIALVLGVQAWDTRLGGKLSLEWGMKRYLAFLAWAQKRIEVRKKSNGAA